ncbi:MAG TPA: lyase family protein [Gammaproteobacteria bacterium]
MATAMPRMALAAAAALVAAASFAAEPGRDRFYWLGEMNKASLVMLVEQEIVDADTAAVIARAVARVIEDGARPGASRSGNYLDIEDAMIQVGGFEVTRIHTGRSRQDLLATSNRLMQRDELLEAFDRLAAARAALLTLAEEHANGIMPAYTWGQQAQPFTMGHFLLAFSESLERIAERMREAYARLNRSPLGSAALGTSSFPVSRERLAELLGFDGVVENSFGALHVAPIDMGTELAGLATSTALALSGLLEYVSVQYHDPQPWIVLDEADGGSSIMPQKRNPTSLVNLRAQASRLVGAAETYSRLAHNVEAGMTDYKGSEPQEVLHGLAELLGELAVLVRRLRFDAARALAEVNADYSTTTELADVLQRAAGVPFRIGHHFASELVTFGRARGLTPRELPYREARRIYAETASELGWEHDVLPLSEAEFRRALSAENMIESSLGLGGPQPSEVARMLLAQTARLREDRSWLDERRARLERAANALNAAFAALTTRH